MKYRKQVGAFNLHASAQVPAAAFFTSFYQHQEEWRVSSGEHVILVFFKA